MRLFELFLNHCEQEQTLAEKIVDGRNPNAIYNFDIYTLRDMRTFRRRNRRAAAAEVVCVVSLRDGKAYWAKTCKESPDCKVSEEPEKKKKKREKGCENNIVIWLTLEVWTESQKLKIILEIEP